MLRIVFLCSGGGGNLRFVSEAIRLRALENAEICGVITDRACPAGLFAKQNDIPLFLCDFSEKDQLGVSNKLADLCPGIIVSNVHKILSPRVVDMFRGKLINLHYSLLPAFAGVIGAKALNQALEYGVQIVGTTVHFVDNLVDSGSPLVQAAIPVNHGDEIQDLMNVVFRVGCISLLTGMQLIREDRRTALGERCSPIEILGHSVLLNPAAASFPQIQDESFWERLR
ncbi:MAG: formyltransferase family protein [Pseudomonadota bacterium]|nr:formyltransferase family protein [Pseudomonadota bacterium]MDP1903383.1 formyltransferase family protein [Pseudomonadota bacterium]MDP2352353.1 formyltransferase family protein [Pseudomonadota bacterium]